MMPRLPAVPALAIPALAIPAFFAIALAITFGTATATQAQESPQFQMPLECEIGVDCWVLRYFDHDDGPGTRDHECGFMTGDDHKGIDIRIRDYVAMYKGMVVVAAADGVVKATRDGIDDVAVQDNPDSREEISRYGLGNTVIVNHSGGWQTAYGHMKKGSVLVSEGDHVTAGQPLGLVGLSGLTTFPHVHFMAKYKGKAVDPFTGLKADPACGETSNTLWSANALDELIYIPTALLIAGFADAVPTVELAENGRYDQSALRADGAAIAFWYHVMGLAKGDREQVRLVGPDGKAIAETSRTSDRNRVLAFGFVGDKLNGRLLAPGVYRGEYQIVRNVDGIDQTVVDKIVEITVR